MRRVIVAATLGVAALGAAGCGGGGSGGRSTAAAAVVSSSPAITGRVVDAPLDSLVFLVAPDPAARSLEALAGTIVDSAEVGADGAFAFADPAPGASEVLVSAPGRALTRAPLGAPVRLAPEAVVTLVATGDGAAPELLALALVLDPDGRALPIPALEAVADEQGALRLTRLPAGAWEVLVASGDDERHGRALVTVAAGQQVRVDLVLAVDPDLARRFAEVEGLGHDALDPRGESTPPAADPAALEAP